MSHLFKSILFILIILFWLFNFVNKVSAYENEVSFIVTAYYSPLPNQKRYTTWSYAWDIRLNWEWHTTASWKPVSVWILAAPKKYPFWTKIYFNWFGIWVVEDRWWAIVKAWIRWYEHDRIDIWMWYWDEWLERALKWGKRTIKWKVVARSSEINLEYTKNVLTNIEKIKVNPEIHKIEDVKNLQENFKKLELYSGKIDWVYKSIENPLIDFQIKHKLIRSREEDAAWWFGPKTYIKLLQLYWNKEVLVKKYNTKIIDTSHEVQIILTYLEIELNWDDPQKEEIIKVQDLFKQVWLYNWVIDWDFNKIKRILLDFQKEAWIIKTDTSWWAWYFWEKTKSALITYFENKNIETKKKITIDDISYETLNDLWKKLQNYPEKEKLVKNLTIAKNIIKSQSQKDKIEYLINLLT